MDVDAVAHADGGPSRVEKEPPAAGTSLTPYSEFGSRSHTLPLYRMKLELQNFSIYYFIGRDAAVRDDLVVHVHGNGICVVGLAPFHTLRTRPAGSARLVSLSFNVHGRDYAQIELSGKRKRGAQSVDAATVIAEIAEEQPASSSLGTSDASAPLVSDAASSSFSDAAPTDCAVDHASNRSPASAAVHRIRAAVALAMIVEVNDVALKRPQLILEEPEGRGWLAVLLSKDLERSKRELIAPAEYFRLRANAT